MFYNFEPIIDSKIVTLSPINQSRTHPGDVCDDVPVVLDLLDGR